MSHVSQHRVEETLVHGRRRIIRYWTVEAVTPDDKAGARHDILEIAGTEENVIVFQVWDEGQYQHRGVQ